MEASPILKPDPKPASAKPKLGLRAWMERVLSSVIVLLTVLTPKQCTIFVSRCGAAVLSPMD